MWDASSFCFTSIPGIPLQQQKEKYTLSNVNIVKHEPQRTKEYIEMFFLPMPPNYRNEVDLRYTVHKPLKRPDLPRNLLTMATHADFDKLSEEGSEIHEIFSKEKQIIANLSAEVLVPNTDLIRGSMETIFNKPRNAQVDSYARDIVGSYIYEKMGRSGMVVTIQDYKKDLPLKKYMQMKGMDYNEVGAYFLNSLPTLAGYDHNGVVLLLTFKAHLVTISF